ncbi:MAG: hypothetical protein FWE05_03500 [Defluviitaleaceae bacterium]|nr:hypothetical protein [Defluviitaleaceae bacterium]
MSEQTNQNNHGKLEKIVLKSLEFPGVKINRTSFLQKELSKYFDDDIVKKAIETRPAQAGINIEDIECIAKACINNETLKVSALSAVAGIPGGFTMAIAMTADSIQFFAHIIRILQKLAYLYGWQEILGDEDGFDDETQNQLILFLGVMLGVNAANITLSKIALLSAQNVPKQLIRKALTKGVVYPVIKKTSAAIGIRMTKPIFAKAVGKIIPIVGAVASGGITYAFFKPMSKRLKNYLKELPLASIEYLKE